MILAFAQGIYYLITGIWPLVHMKSFLFVTGPKTDLWLVRCVGVLVTVIGAVLLQAANRHTVDAHIFSLAFGCAVGLAIIDIAHVRKKIIARIYLADAAIQIALAILWILLTG